MLQMILTLPFIVLSSTINFMVGFFGLVSSILSTMTAIASFIINMTAFLISLPAMIGNFLFHCGIWFTHATPVLVVASAVSSIYYGIYSVIEGLTLFISDVSTLISTTINTITNKGQDVVDSMEDLFSEISGMVAGAANLPKDVVFYLVGLSSEYTAGTTKFLNLIGSSVQLIFQSVIALACLPFTYAYEGMVCTLGGVVYLGSSLLDCLLHLGSEDGVNVLIGLAVIALTFFVMAKWGVPFAISFSIDTADVSILLMKKFLIFCQSLASSAAEETWALVIYLKNLSKLLLSFAISRLKTIPRHVFAVIKYLIRMPAKLWEASKPPQESGYGASCSKSNADEFLLCIICQEAPRNQVLLPCRHTCLCADCLARVKQDDPLCPICRHPIRRSMRVYL